MADNPFFSEVVTGPCKTISLNGLLRLLLGFGSSMMSKRLLPAMAIPNARIRIRDVRSPYPLVWKGDLMLYEDYRTIFDVANYYGIELLVYPESGEEPVWSSKTPDIWRGYVPEEFWKHYPKLHTESISIALVYPFLKKLADQSREQWAKDHGLSKTVKKKTVKKKKKVRKR